MNLQKKQNKTNKTNKTNNKQTNKTNNKQFIRIWSKLLRWWVIATMYVISFYLVKSDLFLFEQECWESCHPIMNEGPTCWLCCTWLFVLYSWLVSNWLIWVNYQFQDDKGGSGDGNVTNANTTQSTSSTTRVNIFCVTESTCVSMCLNFFANNDTPNQQQNNDYQEPTDDLVSVVVLLLCCCCCCCCLC